MEMFRRTQFLIGRENLEKLFKSKVAIFGVGGVGGAVVEALVRSGISDIAVIDFDRVDITNLNRQIISLISNINQYKVDVIENRIKDINPKINVFKFNLKIDENTINDLNLKKFLLECDYIVDAIDDINGKVEIIKFAYFNNKKIISAMGAGNRLNPLDFEVTTIEKTSYCKLAKIVRKKLKDLNIRNIKVVYSKEIPKKVNLENLEKYENERIIGSISFVPPVSGYVIASEVIKDIIK